MPIAMKRVMMAAKIVPIANKTQRERCQTSRNHEAWTKTSTAIRDVCCYGKQEQTEEKINRKDGLRRRITHCKIDNHNACKGEVVDHPSRLPKFNGIGKVVPQGRTVHER